MEYCQSLIRIDDRLEIDNTMFSLVLLKAQAFSMIFNGTRCFLDGMYLLCLDRNEVINTNKNNVQVNNLCFAPRFVNVNLNFDLIASKRYPLLCEKHQYPDFRLFRERTDEYFGIIPLTNAEFDLAVGCFNKIKTNIKNCYIDTFWSCRSRSALFSLLNIANAANKFSKNDFDNEAENYFLHPEIYYGDEKNIALCKEVIKYIKENLHRPMTIPELCKQFSTNRTTLTSVFKDMTGQTPVQYVLTERLKQSRLELLFTNIPVYEVSQKYGFHDENYYIRAFKKQYKKTPLAFRKDGLSERIKEHR